MNIKLSHINCFYGQNQVLRDVSLNYQLSETVVLLGPSGAGKSSLLKVFNLLNKPTSGSLSIANMHCDFSKSVSGKLIREIRKKVGMVFQNYNLWPHLTVIENLIEAPCQVLSIDKKTAIEKAEALLQRLQLAKFRDRYPLHLSGGQQQRVAICRALIMEPKILLFDEPTAALDPEITSQIAEIINELSKVGITQIVVSHDIAFAKKIATRVIYMENSHIIEEGDASCLTAPKTPQLKAYLSH